MPLRKQMRGCVSPQNHDESRKQERHIYNSSARVQGATQTDNLRSGGILSPVSFLHLLECTNFGLTWAYYGQASTTQALDLWSPVFRRTRNKRAPTKLIRLSTERNGNSSVLVVLRRVKAGGKKKDPRSALVVRLRLSKVSRHMLYWLFIQVRAWSIPSFNGLMHRSKRNEL